MSDSENPVDEGAKAQASESENGFICPMWALPYWQAENCTIENTSDGGAAIVDHNIQTTIYIAKTVEECERFLNPPNGPVNENFDDGYSVEEWLRDCAEFEGVLKTCPDCNAEYWEDDGHPEGTTCPTQGIPFQPGRQILGKNPADYITCNLHGIEYFHEDSCPECDKMI